MENRRQNYRHTFAPYERIPVCLNLRHARYIGEIVNLSLGGFLVRLNGRSAALGINSSLIATFHLPEQNVHFEMDGRTIHQQQENLGWNLGVEWLPLADPAAQRQRDRALWRFLLREQQRSIRSDRVAAKTYQPHLALYDPEED